MKKALKVLLVASMAFAVWGCSSKKGSDTIKGTYSAHIEGFDWGCGTTKVIVTMDYVLDAVKAEDFKVTETKQVTDFTQAPAFPVVETTVDRQVTDAYLCNEKGEKVDEPSKNVALELYVSPNDGSPLLFSMTTMYNTWSDPYYLTITPSDTAKLTSDGKEVKSLTVETTMTSKTTSADVFKTDQFEAKDGTKYAYAHYEPKEKADTLFVWLHGMGEGGTDHTDPSVVLLANKVTALAKEEFQNTVGNAYILAPQSPTYWMDVDGKGAGLGGAGPVPDGTSYYTESLTELIDSYKEKCGATKVVIGGCSNGGYMTMVLAMEHGDKYDAYIPICEAVPDAFITDEQIAKLAELPMFFIYSNDDTTVDPTLHEIPTIERLKAAGAKNVHVSTSDHVVDTSGEIKDAEGNPYQYMGHWSWIYFDNNDSKCDDCQQDSWHWIADQVK